MGFCGVRGIVLCWVYRGYQRFIPWLLALERRQAGIFCGGIGARLSDTRMESMSFDY